MSSVGQRERGPRAEPLLGAPCLEPLCLGEPQLEADPAYVLLNGTLAECDRVGDSRTDHSA
jgi:hypothetical protein